MNDTEKREMIDFIQRCVKAERTLTNLSAKARGETEMMRLAGKSDGVSLALSYLREVPGFRDLEIAARGELHPFV